MRWFSSRLRLALLMLCLGAASVGLLVSRTSVLSAVGLGHGSGAAGASNWCVPDGLPEPAGVGLGRLVELRAALLAATPRASRRYAAGIVSPADMWSDDVPQTLRATRSSAGGWPAGYELRWWTPSFDKVADVFVFSGPRQARAFFELAAGARCHGSGARWPVTVPLGARGLSWVNPDGAPQEDVFLLRGVRVYRVGVVRLARTPTVARRVDFEFAQALACGLPAAGCFSSALPA
jgi:hypothetical protein